MSKLTKETRFWVNVVSHEHVKNGVKAGITQSCHGKSAPLKRMHQGDWIVHYSPKDKFGGKDPCQQFTSLGCVEDGEVYPFDMGGGFIPWRRNIRYLNAKPLSILPLKEDLSFTQDRDKNWGMMFRFGFFEMTEDDFKTIYKGMMGQEFNPNASHAFLATPERVGLSHKELSPQMTFDEVFSSF